MQFFLTLNQEKQETEQKEDEQENFSSARRAEVCPAEEKPHHSWCGILSMFNILQLPVVTQFLSVKNLLHFRKSVLVTVKTSRSLGLKLSKVRKKPAPIVNLDRDNPRP